MAKLDEHIKVMMLKGETGANIKSIDKTATSGLVDTYTVTLTDGTKSNFTVTNGKDGKDGADFDAFEIGGRNIARNSAKLDISPDKGNLYAGPYNCSDAIYRGDGFNEVRVEWPYGGICIYANSLGLNPGDYFTLSAAFEPHGRDLTPHYVAFCSDSSGTQAPITLETSRALGTVKDGENKRVSATIKWTDDAKSLIDSGGTVILSIQTWTDLARDSGNSAYIYAPKLERSTKPSDWTPAPEDKADVSALAEKADVSTILPKASVESSATASQAYAAGDYVVVNGVLRKVKNAIAKGNTISDSNSTATTVGGELATLGDSVSQQQAANKYSTSETDTGRTWVDGKKIYRRVVRLGYFGSGETRKSIGFKYDNIVSAVFLSGDSDGATGSQMPLYPNDTYWRADATMYGTDVVVRIGASHGGCYVTGIFEYTK